VYAPSLERIHGLLAEDDLVLDVGGWASPLPRADWVIDLMPYDTRGLYGERDRAGERFTRETWLQRDVCEREPWPFEDDRFDFAICSQTLEDVRDPIWVCGELNRVALAGYIEVPSRLEEQGYGVHGPWVGWSHHRWLVEVGPSEIEFVSKPHHLAGSPAYHLPPELTGALTPDERVQTLFWRGSFRYAERIFMEPHELDRYLAQLVEDHRERLAQRVPRRGRIERARRRAAAILARADH